jgi:fermentation-respiration switch protein FrsA (DUF1100 family)
MPTRSRTPRCFEQLLYGSDDLDESRRVVDAVGVPSTFSWWPADRRCRRCARSVSGESTGGGLAGPHTERSWPPPKRSSPGRADERDATRSLHSPLTLQFLASILDFDPAPVIARVQCPVLALFGASDSLVPVSASVEAFAAHLATLPGDPGGIGVFPRANHGLFVADPSDGIDRTSQLAPGFLAMLTGFIEQMADHDVSVNS